MTPRQRRIWLDLTCVRFLNAMEADDLDTLVEIWNQAAADPELEAALEEMHAGLVEERAAREAQLATDAVAAAVAKHMPSAEIVRPASGPLTVADVAERLFRHAPPRLPAAAHALNEALRASREPLPESLGLSKLVAWAEARFGPAAREYWRAFQQAAIDLELRRASEAEYRMAARAAPKKEGQP